MMKLQTLTFILTISILFACGGQKRTDTDLSEVEQEPVSINFDTLSDLEKIVDGIERGKRVEGPLIGKGGVPSEQWDKYNQLKETATIDQLVALTDHKNSAVRCYAFHALAAKHSDKIFPVLLKHLNDKSSAFILRGCIGTTLSTCDYFVHIVTNDYIEAGNYQLNQTEKKTLDSILLNDKSILISSNLVL